MAGGRLAKTLALAPACAALMLALPGAASAAVGTCDQPPHAGGEWPSYGHDLSNSRSQPAETTIGAANANAIEPAFVYAAPGLVNSTPIVAGGCVFVASQGATTTTGTVTALDADSGERIWSATIPVGAAGYGGPVVGSPALFEDLVIVPVNRQGAPFLLALDRDTGAERWRTTIDHQPLEGVNASAVVHDGIVFIGFFGNADAGSHERGGFALLDAATGALLKKTFVIDDASFEQGYAGAGIWSTAAIDADTGFAYAGTSNPHSEQREHERSDSLLKIDLNRSSPAFGEIVASYKGVHDTVIPGAQNQPVCEAKPDVYYAYHFSATCLAVDVDFGASPNLFTAGGRTLLGDLQKSGTYHVVDTADMSGVTRTQVGVPCFSCNAASPAFHDGRAFVAAGPPGQLAAVDPLAGLPAWVAPIGGGLTYQPVSVANGMVWTTDSAGFLDGYDERTGVQLVKRPMRLDTGAAMIEATSSAGIAIARNTLYTAASSYVIAYRPAS